MKRTVIIFISILIINYIALSLLAGAGEYAAERLFYRATRVREKIARNPDVVPPAMFAAVEKNLQTILERYPKTKIANRAQEALAGFYASNKEYDKALAVLETIIDRPEQDRIILSRAYFLRGNVYEQQDRWDKALVEYARLQEAYKDTPIGIQIPLYIGDYYAEKGKNAEADRAYNKAVIFYEKIAKEDKGRATGYVAATLLARTHINLNRYEEAGKVTEDIINTYPSNLTYMQHLPNLEHIFVKSLNNPQKAIEIYTRIKEKTDNERLRESLEKRIEVLEEIASSSRPSAGTSRNDEAPSP